MATHSSILAWRIPWTEEPGKLQSMGSQRVGHDLVTEEQQEFRKGNQKDPIGNLGLLSGLGSFRANWELLHGLGEE